MQLSAPGLARNGNPGIVPSYLAKPVPAAPAPKAPAPTAAAAAKPAAGTHRFDPWGRIVLVPTSFTREPRVEVEPGEKEAALKAIHATQTFFDKLGVGPREGNDPRLDVILSPNFDNAEYDMENDSIKIGRDPSTGTPFAYSQDVLAHEYSHRIVDSMLHLGSTGQQGAMHESLADTFASAMDDDWTIGEDVTPGGVRDMLHPERFGDPADASQFQSLPKNIYNDMGGVHVNAAIPNRAAALIGEQLGRGTMAQIYVDAMRNYMDSRTGIVDAAKATLLATADRYGDRSQEVEAVSKAWDAVGVLDYVRQGR